MITNPNTINILCFGDSNTHGQKPDKSSRYTSDTRWTGQLQNVIGDGYNILEEGLGGRTTDIDDTKKIGKSGKLYLVPALSSHNPLNIVIIMLGTNDLKTRFKRSSKEVADAIKGLIEDVRQYAFNKEVYSSANYFD